MCAPAVTAGLHETACKSSMCCSLDNCIPDAAITMGMVLLNEAATSKGDVGKRRSKFLFLSLFTAGI
jgi:hypothetical protein